MLSQILNDCCRSCVPAALLQFALFRIEGMHERHDKPTKHRAGHKKCDATVEMEKPSCSRVLLTGTHMHHGNVCTIKGQAPIARLGYGYHAFSPKLVKETQVTTAWARWQTMPVKRVPTVMSS